MPELNLHKTFLGRQPILDRAQQMFAYELSFCDNASKLGVNAHFEENDPVAIDIISNAFTEFSMADALGPYRGFFKVGKKLLFSPLLDTLLPQSVTLELLETNPPSPEVLARCEQLRDAGFMLSIREESASVDPCNPLLKLATVIKVDTQKTGFACLPALTKKLKPLGKTLLAEHVDSAEQMQLCYDSGFDLFQGYYFTKISPVHNRKLPASKFSLLRLLELLSRDSDNDEIEAVFKQEPMLAVNLLRLTNSAASGMAVRISSLRHAIVLLGHRQLLRWLQLLLYSGISAQDSFAINPLLQLAATRGRLMELLVARTPEGKRCGRDLIDQAYMVGILSLMPTLIGKSMHEILVRLPLMQRVNDALDLRSGVLGDLLDLVEALESASTGNDSANKLETVLKRLPDINACYANSSLIKALSWANHLSQEVA